MAKIIGVKFKNTAKVYYFAPANENEVYEEKTGVVVETAKGLEYGTVVFGVKEVDEKEIVHPLKPVLRKATEKDEKTVKENEKKIPEAMDFAQEKITELNLQMKLIGAEYAFDGKKLVFYFTSDNRVDFRELVKVLASRFHVRIELRQIGIRDETKILGGIAPCGRECCCASCMSDFGKVSIKMAKNQGLHLNPGKISGLCGRLMCCLEYENDYYAEVYGKMPKVGGTVNTPEGQGTVVSNDMLKLISKVKISKGDGSEVYKDFPVDRLEFKKNKQSNENDDDNVSEDMKKILD
ncbi:MAG: stage 0 sporulation protein [Clostridiales bacterium]|nr:stage 0 sporulation protein [Clostridiales bacterium]